MKHLFLSIITLISFLITVAHSKNKLPNFIPDSVSDRFKYDKIPNTEADVTQYIEGGYFPEIEYPSSILVREPFFFKSKDQNFDAFPEDVKITFKHMSATKGMKPKEAVEINDPSNTNQLPSQKNKLYKDLYSQNYSQKPDSPEENSQILQDNMRISASGMDKLCETKEHSPCDDDEILQMELDFNSKKKTLNGMTDSLKYNSIQTIQDNMRVSTDGIGEVSKTKESSVGYENIKFKTDPSFNYPEKTLNAMTDSPKENPTQTIGVSSNSTGKVFEVAINELFEIIDMLDTASGKEQKKNKYDDMSSETMIDRNAKLPFSNKTMDYEKKTEEHNQNFLDEKNYGYKSSFDDNAIVNSKNSLDEVETLIQNNNNESFQESENGKKNKTKETPPDYFLLEVPVSGKEQKINVYDDISSETMIDQNTKLPFSYKTMDYQKKSEEHNQNFLDEKSYGYKSSFDDNAIVNSKNSLDEVNTLIQNNYNESFQESENGNKDKMKETPPDYFPSEVPVSGKEQKKNEYDDIPSETMIDQNTKLPFSNKTMDYEKKTEEHNQNFLDKQSYGYKSSFDDNAIVNSKNSLDEVETLIQNKYNESFQESENGKKDKMKETPPDYFLSEVLMYITNATTTILRPSFFYVNNTESNESDNNTASHNFGDQYSLL